jgi:hypothetical protein
MLPQLKDSLMDSVMLPFQVSVVDQLMLVPLSQLPMLPLVPPVLMLHY